MADGTRLAFLLGASCLVGFVTVIPPGGVGAHRAPLAFHLALIVALVLGTAFRDAVGRVLRVAGPVMALVACLFSISGRHGGAEGVPHWAIDAYPLVMSVLVAVYGLLLGERTALAVAGAIASAWLVALAGRGYGTLRQLVAGLDYIATGMALFALAVVTSVAKGGVHPWRGRGEGQGPRPSRLTCERPANRGRNGSHRGLSTVSSSNGRRIA